MSFYVTLPSNASMNAFPNNSQANYTTLLPKSIELHDKYQVGLAEISYTQSISSNIGSCIITQDTLINDSFKSVFGTQKFEIITEDCISFENLIEQINNEITKLFREFYYKESNNKDLFTFDDARNKFMPLIKSFKSPNLFFTIDMPTNTSIKLEGPIIQILKYDSNKFDFLEAHSSATKRFFQSQFDPILHLCDNFLVYTDIITDQFYGDVSAKILRNVIPGGLHGDKISLTYNTIHYVDLQFTKLDSININIRDSQGELIHFSDKLGKVVIKLHFKLK